MPIAFTETRKVPGLRSVRLLGTLTFSGSYATGGEVPSGLVPPGTTKAPFFGNVIGKGVYDYKYDLATGKIKVFTAGAEHAAAAYNAAVTAENGAVQLELEYPKLG